MKHKRRIGVLLSLCMVGIMVAQAKPQEAQAAAIYEHMEIASGFNRDVVATSSTSGSAEHPKRTESLDMGYGTTSSSGAVLYSSGFSSSSGYLPSDRVVSSKRTSGLSWKLGSYTSNNALKLGKGNSGTLTFSKTGCYQKIYILSICGGVEGGSTSMSATINYTDGTSSAATFTVVDWYSSSNYATAEFRRVEGTSLSGSTSSGPYMTQSIMNGLDTSKLVKSISITNTGTNSSIYLNVFAVTGLTANVEVPAPTHSETRTTSFALNWQEAEGASTYRVDVATDTNFTNILSSYNNKIVTTTECMVTGLERDTTYYYRVRGVASNGGQSASSSVKSVRTHKCDVFYNDNGGSGGPGITDLTANWTLPASVAVPTRTGYTFTGYYTAMINGTQYYNADGTVCDAVAEQTFSTYELPLYAQWTIHKSSMTVDANGGTYAGETSFTDKRYNDTVRIPDPTPPDETKSFSRWEISPVNGSVVKGAGYSTYVFGPQNGVDVTLTAVWYSPDQLVVEKDAEVIQEIEVNNLESVAEQHLSAEEIEKNGKIVTVFSPAEEEDDRQAIEALVETAKNHAVVEFIDISVVKRVEGEADEKLSELDSAAEIVIELTGSLADRTGYSVYRVHNGAAEQLSSDASKSEYYKVENNRLYIYSKKFSTYAVTASETSTGALSAEELLENGNNVLATDVQGKYTDGSDDIVYKIDIEWGAMEFTFNKHQKWDPENHVYTDEITILLDESAYEGGNNEIVVTNHSNAGVRVNMHMEEKRLDGTEIRILQENLPDASVAKQVELGCVPAEGAEPYQTNAYVRFDDGMINYDAFEEILGKDFVRVATIVVTVTPVTDSEITPVTTQ